LLRFYDVNQGKISIGGINIKKFSKKQLRSLISIVPQEPILFNNTIGFNIAYGNSQAGRRQIVQASKIANINDFIEKLPNGFQTYVGERGIKLSGGQRQRIAIARALLVKPKIIVFDEATSQLDSESEALIQNSLRKIARNKTILIIAHRFSTIKMADKIIVVDSGKIAEIGSHQKLIRKNGFYRYLWEIQAGERKSANLRQNSHQFLSGNEKNAVGRKD
jgi:ABC-type multidrug transport system fused ATPase/permease subunit